MSYLGSMRGDYGPRTYRGDPGILGSLWRGIKGAATGFITGGPTGIVTGGIRGLTRGKAPIGKPAPSSIRMPSIGRPYAAPAPTYKPGTRATTPLGMPYIVEGRKRRRMNVGNAKALRRAIRRQTGFVKLARRALKGTGYTIVTRGARRRAGVSVSETGPGSVTVRR